MKHKKEMSGLLSRDKNYNKIVTIILLIPVIYYIAVAMHDIKQFLAGYQYSLADPMIALHLDVLLPLSCISIIAIQMARWVFYENESAKYTTMSLPVSSQTFVKYDIYTGMKFLCTANLIYFVGTLIQGTIGTFLYCSAVIRDQGYATVKPYLADWILGNINFSAVEYLPGLCEAFLTVLLIYALFVLGKYISAKYEWALVFMICTSVAIYSIGSVIDGKIIFPLLGWRISYVITTIGKIPLIIICYMLSFRAAKAKDEARHGAYYFKTPRWIVSLMITMIVIFGALLGIAEFSPVMKTVFTLLSIFVLGGGTLCGMLYVTAEKHS